MGKNLNLIRAKLLQSGAVAVGWTEAEPVDEKAWRKFLGWLEKGCHAGMGYMSNHQEIRRDPRLLLDGARTVISLAYSFAPPAYRADEKGMIACYAYGDDYHDVLRRKLRVAVEKLKGQYGGEYRICIDSAPIMERYWAVKAGIGKIGCNGSVIIPGYGSMVFLAEILTTLELSSCMTDESFPEPYSQLCTGCNACIAACPYGALAEEGDVDSRRCLSYLTIEHHGEWDSEEGMQAMQTEAGRNTIFGCDLCLRHCHLNMNLPPTDIPEFAPRPEIMALDRKQAPLLTREQFSLLFKGSPIKRAKLEGIIRNTKV